LLLLAFLAACASPATRAPDFTLTEDGGQAWTLSAQHGRPVLLTFGFANCADTCPATVAKLAHVARALGANGHTVEVVLVTVDPTRDTPAALHRFVERFDGPVIGLTGTPAQIASVESAYHVWAQRVPGKHHSSRNYDVAHTAIIYAIDAGGSIRAIHNDADSGAALMATARRLAD
jgi:protein SCO1/2